MRRTSAKSTAVDIADEMIRMASAKVRTANAGWTLRFPAARFSQ